MQSTNQKQTKTPTNSKSSNIDAFDDLVKRIPPHSVEAEQAVLGGVFLRDNKVFHSLVDIVSPDDFYLPAHQNIYAAFVELYRRGTPIDPVTTHEYLRDHNTLEQSGGAAYLAQLAQTVVGGANAEYYAATVRDKSMQRSLIHTCSNIISNCYDSSISVDSLLNESAGSVMTIAERTTGKMFRSTSEMVDEVFKKLEERLSKHELVTGVTTGYTQLDKLTAGLQQSDLIIVAARPSMGKTAFSLNMALNAAVKSNVPVAVFSLEMSTDQLMMRMLCSYGKINLAHLRRGYLEDDEWARIYDAADVIKRAPIFIDDTPGITPLELQARTRRLKAEHGLGFVLVDYLQLMRAGRRTDSREQEISEISRSLKALAKEHNIPVVALSQLNRKVEERADKRPLLSDLRESGAIEQDADVIMFIYRDEVYNKRPDNERAGIAEIIIGKQRNGPTGTAYLHYAGAYTSFEDLELDRAAYFASQGTE